ncbi:MAG: hypothetical protein WAM14_06815, partial [Candidatus Nitrosopolaris sp.]
FIRQYKGLFLRPIARQEMRLYVCELHKACKMLLEVIIHSPILIELLYLRSLILPAPSKSYAIYRVSLTFKLVIGSRKAKPAQLKYESFDLTDTSGLALNAICSFGFIIGIVLLLTKSIHAPLES